jgi:hypothetical protein
LAVSADYVAALRIDSRIAVGFDLAPHFAGFRPVARSDA